MALTASAIILAFWVGTRDGGKVADIVFALILGGAIGNLIDRIRLGYAIDFLLVHVGERSFFVFNLADAAVTVGLLLLVSSIPTKPRQ